MRFSRLLSGADKSPPALSVVGEADGRSGGSGGGGGEGSSRGVFKKGVNAVFAVSRMRSPVGVVSAVVSAATVGRCRLTLSNPR